MKWLLFLGVLMSLTLAVCAEVNDDPHLWLEEVTGDKALAWVKERNAESTAALTENDAFRTLHDRLLQILDSDARIPFVSKAGDYYYNFWRDAKHTRGVWRRTTLEAYRQDKPHWEMVLDLDALAAAEQENWVWKGSNCLKPSYQRCLLSLSRGGADATVTREFDVTQKVFVADGFVLPEAKSRISWRDLDSVFVATDFGPGSLTRSGYPRIVKEWRRGTAVADAVQVFAGQLDDVSVGAFRTKTPGYERDWISRSLTFWTHELFLRREGQLIKIEKPDDARAVSDRDLLYIALRTPWTVGGKTWPAGALLVADLERFLQGERQFDLLFEPGERKSLAGFTPARHHLLLNELDNVRNRLSVLTREDGTMAPRRASRCAAVQRGPCHARRSGHLRRLLHDGHRLSDAAQSLYGHAGSRTSGETQGRPGVLRRGWARREPARGGLGGRDADTVFSGGTPRPGAQRPESDAALRLRRFRGRDASRVPGGDGSGMARGGRRIRRRQYPRRWGIRTTLAPGGPAAEPAQGV